MQRVPCGQSAVRHAGAGVFQDECANVSPVVCCFRLAIVFRANKPQQFVWGLRDGGMALPHLFVKKVITRFFFLRYQIGPFVRTCLRLT